MADLETLINDLRHEDVQRRRDAANELMQVGDPIAVEPLIFALLYDRDTETKSNATVALGRLGDERAITPLIIALDRDDISADVKSTAIYALGNIGVVNEDITNALVKAIKHEDREVRLAAVYACGVLKAVHAINALIQALDDGELKVRNNAAQVLGKLGDARAVDPLMALLKTTDYDQLKRSIIAALADLKHQRAVAPLVEILKHDTERSMREAAALALGKIGSEQALQALLVALKDKNQRVREAAAEALQTSKMGHALHSSQMPRLIMETGSQIGAAIPVVGESFTIGRAVANANWDLKIDDPSLSRPHARLVHWQGGWYVEDLNSGNGTSVNDFRLTEPSWLVDGDVIALGNTQLTFRWNPPPNPNPNPNENETP